jgi:hypothetical protein
MSTSKAKQKNRIKGEATYTKKAYQIDGAVPFARNSGYELSNSDGIKALEKEDKLLQLVCYYVVLMTPTCM